MVDVVSDERDELICTGERHNEYQHDFRYQARDRARSNSMGEEVWLTASRMTTTTTRLEAGCAILNEATRHTYPSGAM